MRAAARAAALGLWLLWAAIGGARAASYEGAGVAQALARADLRAAPMEVAEGRPVVAVLVLRAAVFIEEEWPPTALNHLHALTREAIIRRELRVAEGQPFAEAAAAESARGLRALNIFAFVAVVPYEAPGGVGVAVITRDLWSLRLETGFQLTGGVVDNLNVRLTERNLFGRAQLAALGVQRTGFTDGINELFTDHRLLGHPLRLSEGAQLVFRRDNGAFDGLNGQITLERPFYNLEQPWGFSLSLSGMDQNIRHLAGDSLLTWDDPTTATAEAIPRAWRQRWLALSAVARRQWSGRFTPRVSVGLGFSDAVLRPAEEIPQAHHDAFQRYVLGPDVRQIYPLISGVVFERRYRVYSDLASFGVSEEIRLGPMISLNALTPLTALGASEDSLAVGGALAWAEAPWGGIVEAAIGAEARLVTAGWVNQRILLRARAATPKLALGRLVTRGDWVGHEAERGSQILSLGGNNGLRGYPSDAIWAINAHRLRANVEWRSPPLTWSFIHLGGALFYDGGAVYQRLDALKWRGAIGAGLRLLLPQLNRSVFRLDVGAPLEGGYSLIWSLGDAQMVPMPGREDSFFEGDIGGLVNQP